MRRLADTFHCAAVGIAHDAQLSQRLEVRGIRDPRKSTMEAWDAPGEPGDLSSLSAQTEWLNQQPMVRKFFASRGRTNPAPRPIRPALPRASCRDPYRRLNPKHLPPCPPTARNCAGRRGCHRTHHSANDERDARSEPAGRGGRHPHHQRVAGQPRAGLQ